jgi:hypothetical protein
MVELSLPKLIVSLKSADWAERFLTTFTLGRWARMPGQRSQP